MQTNEGMHCYECTIKCLFIKMLVFFSINIYIANLIITMAHKYILIMESLINI